ncbi:MAG: HEAT repeat domain-containing protein [Anaerolineales bacterium]|nr:HEAT repeat domain-containing protein [Anaerolineales bacterium]
MENHIAEGLECKDSQILINYAADNDTYIRKQAYIILGKLYHQKEHYQPCILELLEEMLSNDNEKIRQTAVYALGEIGDFEKITPFLEQGLEDAHHSVRNAVIGALKQLGRKYPSPILAFARRHLHDPNPEIRRQIIHGIELHGRTHPQDILPLLQELQDDPNRRVSDMVIHVLGQISYKRGCLETVIQELKTWQNRVLVSKAMNAILKVHAEQSYCAYSLEEAHAYIQREIGGIDIKENAPSSPSNYGHSSPDT